LSLVFHRLLYYFVLICVSRMIFFLFLEFFSIGISIGLVLDHEVLFFFSWDMPFYAMLVCFFYWVSCSLLSLGLSGD
jgi:hypothetical protein